MPTVEDMLCPWALKIETKEHPIMQYEEDETGTQGSLLPELLEVEQTVKTFLWKVCVWRPVWGVLYILYFIHQMLSRTRYI